MGKIPNTVARTSHAITITTVDGQTIGMIKEWQPALQRDVTPIYEINAATSGDPVENVPGNAKGMQIRVRRYDLYTKRMEEAFGSMAIFWITDQDNPIQVREAWKFPDNSTEVWVYDGCWFQNIGRNFSSEDQRLVLVDATLVYLKRRPVQVSGMLTV